MPTLTPWTPHAVPLRLGSESGARALPDAEGPVRARPCLRLASGEGLRLLTRAGQAATAPAEAAPALALTWWVPSWLVLQPTQVHWHAAPPRRDAPAQQLARVARKGMPSPQDATASAPAQARPSHAGHAGDVRVEVILRTATLRGEAAPASHAMSSSARTARAISHGDDTRTAASTLRPVPTPWSASVPLVPVGGRGQAGRPGAATRPLSTAASPSTAVHAPDASLLAQPVQPMLARRTPRPVQPATWPAMPTVARAPDPAGEDLVERLFAQGMAQQATPGMTLREVPQPPASPVATAPEAASSPWPAAASRPPAPATPTEARAPLSRADVAQVADEVARVLRQRDRLEHERKGGRTWR